MLSDLAGMDYVVILGGIELWAQLRGGNTLVWSCILHVWFSVSLFDSALDLSSRLLLSCLAQSNQWLVSNDGIRARPYD
jgi:hypothetical protein